MTSTRRATLASLVLASFLSALAPPARAQAPDPAARAAELKKRGDDAMDGGRASEALAAYVDAYALSPEPALLYNKGRALQVLGEYPQALEELQAFEQKAPPELKARVPGLARMIAELKARVTTAAIACDTPGARVRFRDRTIGACPLPPTLVVVSGRGMLEVTAEGYFPYLREVDMPPGGVANLDVRLASKTSAAILIVKSNITSTRVAIDGKDYGMVPVEAILGAGDHGLELRHDGYRTAKTATTLGPGERREIEVPLDTEGSVLGTWWFWTGVGVVVAGGVAVVLALTLEKSPEPGTVSPGVVTGGLSRAGAGFRF